MWNHLQRHPSRLGRLWTDQPHVEKYSSLNLSEAIGVKPWCQASSLRVISLFGRGDISSSRPAFRLAAERSGGQEWPKAIAERLALERPRSTISRPHRDAPAAVPRATPSRVIAIATAPSAPGTSSESEPQCGASLARSNSASSTSIPICSPMAAASGSMRRMQSTPPAPWEGRPGWPRATASRHDRHH